MTSLQGSRTHSSKRNHPGEKPTLLAPALWRVQCSSTWLHGRIWLRMEGELSDCLTFAFEGLAFTRSDGTTALTGQIRDRAELQDVISACPTLGSPCSR
jgi:hypothetical protein